MRFGLIGTGYWAAAVHAPGIVSHPRAELVGVWGRDPAKAERLATQFGVQPFSEVEELIWQVAHFEPGKQRLVFMVDVGEPFGAAH